MNIIFRPRNSGKTTELIHQSHDKWMYIVCIDRRMADWTFHLAQEKNIDILYPITFEELLNGQFYGREIKRFLIDDFDVLIDDFLRRICHGVPVEAIVLNRIKR